jgi:hypothetical protein
MAALAVKFPRINEIGIINTFGVTSLSHDVLPRQKVLQPGGILDYTPETIVTIKASGRTLLFKDIRNDPAHIGARYDFILYDITDPKRYLMLFNDKKVVVGRKSRDSVLINRALGDDFPDLGFTINVSTKEVVVKKEEGDKKEEQKLLETKVTLISLQSQLKMRVEVKSFTTADRSAILTKSAGTLLELRDKFPAKAPFYIWLSSKGDVYGIENSMTENKSGYGMFIEVRKAEKGNFLELCNSCLDPNGALKAENGQDDPIVGYFKQTASLLITRFNSEVSLLKGNAFQPLAPGKDIKIVKDPSKLR